MKKVQTLDSSNMVLIDGNNGTKTILVADFIKSLIGLISSQDFISGVNLSELTQISALTENDKLLIGTAEGNKAIGADDALFAMLDAFIPKEQRRMIYRGKIWVLLLQKSRRQTFKMGLSKVSFWGITGPSAVTPGESWTSITGTTAATPHLPLLIWLSCRISLFIMLR